MASSDDEDFFEALVHSIRSSCFQFLDFREKVSLRGFLALDVDGEHQHHFVLAESVSRGNDDEKGSFQLNTLNTSKTEDAPLCQSYKSPTVAQSRTLGRKRTLYAESPPTKIQKDFNPGLQQDPARMPNTKCRGARRNSSRPARTSSNGFSTSRTDSRNLTFTRDPRKENKKYNETKNITTISDEEASRSLSFTTVNLSPSKTVFHRQDCDPGKKSSNHSNNKVTVTQKKVSQRDVDGRTVSNARKKLRESFVVCPTEAFVCESPPSVTSSPSSTGENGSFDFRDALTQYQHIECILNQASIDMKDRRPNLDSVRNNVIPSRNSMPRDCDGLTSFLCDSDPECSITSVKPKYLVDHADEIIATPSETTSKKQINIFLSQQIESQNHNHNIIQVDGFPKELLFPSSQVGDLDRDATKRSLSNNGFNPYPHQQSKKTNGPNVTEKLGDYLNTIKRCRVDIESEKAISCDEFIERSESSSFSSSSRKANSDIANVTPSLFKDILEENESPLAKRKRKFIKLMRYFKKSQEFTRD